MRLAHLQSIWALFALTPLLACSHISLAGNQSNRREFETFRIADTPASLRLEEALIQNLQLSGHSSGIGKPRDRLTVSVPTRESNKLKYYSPQDPNSYDATASSIQYYNDIAQAAYDCVTTPAHRLRERFSSFYADYCSVVLLEFQEIRGDNHDSIEMHGPPNSYQWSMQTEYIPTTSQRNTVWLTSILLFDLYNQYEATSPKHNLLPSAIISAAYDYIPTYVRFDNVDRSLVPARSQLYFRLLDILQIPQQQISDDQRAILLLGELHSSQVLFFRSAGEQLKEVLQEHDLLTIDGKSPDKIDIQLVVRYYGNLDRRCDVLIIDNIVQPNTIEEVDFCEDIAEDVAAAAAGESATFDSATVIPAVPINELYRDGSRINFVLTRDVLYCRRSTGDVFLIPAGFITDFTSVPLGFRPFLPQTPHEYGAALIHDWLYAISQRGSPEHQDLADQIFLEELQVAGVVEAKRVAAGTALNLAGHEAVGREIEFRFATEKTEQMAMKYRGDPANAIVGNTNCENFRKPKKYFELLSLYASNNEVDVYEVYRNRDSRRRLRLILAGN